MELDSERCLVKEEKLPELQRKLKEVCWTRIMIAFSKLTMIVSKRYRERTRGIWLGLDSRLSRRTHHLREFDCDQINRRPHRPSHYTDLNPNVSSSRRRANPQSPQKWLAMVLPLLAILETSFGWLRRSLKPPPLTMMLVLEMEVILSGQSMQWRHANRQPLAVEKRRTTEAEDVFLFHPHTGVKVRNRSLAETVSNRHGV